MADLKLIADSGGGTVSLKAPAATTSNAAVTLKLPVADGSANQLLKTDGSGQLGWATDSTTDSSKMPLAGGTFTGNTLYNDGVAITLGTGNDTFIRHIAGSHTEIDHVGSGDLVLETVNGGDDILLNSNDDVFIQHAGEDMAVFRSDGGVELYFDNGKKAETVTGGFTISGVCTATSYAGDGSSLTGVASATADGCMYENSQTISNNYTVAATKGAHSVGPITNNAVVTLNGVWVIS